MMLGPGTTNKYYTSGEVAEEEIQIVLGLICEVRQNAMLEEMLNNAEVKIQYAKYSGSTNAYKNAIGTNQAIDLRDFEDEEG